MKPKTKLLLATILLDLVFMVLLILLLQAYK